ncbi:hypothetical protein HYS31_04185, partial [Candidatus Woesearchaeota archaeon]|nr:hypothetical protein [Candidatus Woesearchaeota archaeon]
INTSLPIGTACDFQYRLSSISAPNANIRFGFQPNDASPNRCGDANNALVCDRQSGGVDHDLNVGADSTPTGFDPTAGQTLNVTLLYNTTSHVWIFNQDTYHASASATPYTHSNFSVRYEGNSIRTDLIYVACYNGTLGAPQLGAQTSDILPPEITYYNLSTPNGDCVTWNTDKSNPCNTTDTTPTVYLNTNENAWCAIGVSDLNYTDLGSSRNCDSGQGTESHTCTLTPQDELTFENSNLYIGCRDSQFNQNSTSTSRALLVTINELEDVARNSIELAASNALSASYSIYTAQKVYARNSADSQSVGTFDKVIKKLSKIWAFNRIGSSDTLVGMFNITPVLYTFEYVNKTSAYIQNQTELLINATK